MLRRAAKAAVATTDEAKPTLFWGTDPETTSADEVGAEYDRLHKLYAPRLVDLFAGLGGLYIKTGQYLSVRPEIVPAAYRESLRSLQSDVPARDFADMRSVIEAELGPLSDVFSHFNENPIGAASIGQAYKATTIDGVEVVVKVRYPDAEDNFTADIACIKQVMGLGVAFDVIKDNSVSRFVDELERQLVAELDFSQEVENISEIRNSTQAVFEGRIVIPKPHQHLCKGHVITMTYIPGLSLEDEMVRRLEALGLGKMSSKQDLKNLLRSSNPHNGHTIGDSPIPSSSNAALLPNSSQYPIIKRIFKVLGPNLTFQLIRTAEYLNGLVQWCKAWTLSFGVNHGEDSTKEKFKSRVDSSSRQLLDTLLDVHGYEMFRTNLFNADPHPGNIIVMDNNELGLIDYGQCKRFSDPSIKQSIAKLIVSIAEEKPDLDIANAFRQTGLRTANDDDYFIASFAKLMFGELSAEMMDHEWHINLHMRDRMTEFPPDMIMVTRVAALLRGLAISFQHNCSVSSAWYKHAKKAIL